jgi:hypothetical protein
MEKGQKSKWVAQTRSFKNRVYMISAFVLGSFLGDMGDTVLPPGIGIKVTSYPFL